MQRSGSTVIGDVGGESWHVQVFLRRKPDPATRARLALALLLIGSITAATALTLSAFSAPDWTIDLTVVAFPIAWLVVGTIISLRSSD